MSHDARYALGQKINSLEGVQLFRVLEIINEATPPSAVQCAPNDCNTARLFFMSHANYATGLTQHVFQSEEGDSNGDIEIDLSDLDAGTLYRLQVINIRGCNFQAKFIQECAKLSIFSVGICRAMSC